MGGNLYEVGISSRIYQSVTGKVEEKRATARIDEELVKQINRISDGNVYFRESSKGNIWIDHNYGYADADVNLRDQIVNVIINRVENGEFEEKDGLNVGDITKDDIDLKKFAEAVEKCKKEMEERDRREKERQRIKEEMRQIINEKGLRAEFFGDFVRVSHGFKKDNVFRIIKEITFNYNKDDLSKLKGLSEVEALKEYLAKIERENEELREKLRKTREEIIKEAYENNEVIKVADECERELKVIAIDDEDYY